MLRILLIDDTEKKVGRLRAALVEARAALHPKIIRISDKKNKD